MARNSRSMLAPARGRPGCGGPAASAGADRKRDRRLHHRPPRFPADQQGNFDQKRYADFQDFLEDQSPLRPGRCPSKCSTTTPGSKPWSKLLGGPGYVLPGDVRESLERADAKWTISVATFDYASFDPGLKVSEDALQKYYAENSGRYDVPARPKAEGGRIQRAKNSFPPNLCRKNNSAAYYAANFSRASPPRPNPPRIRRRPSRLPTVSRKYEPRWRFTIAWKSRSAPPSRPPTISPLRSMRAKLPRIRRNSEAGFLASKKRTAVDLPPLHSRKSARWHAVARELRGIDFPAEQGSLLFRRPVLADRRLRAAVDRDAAGLQAAGWARCTIKWRPILR